MTLLFALHMAACGILDPAAETVVSGHVYEDGIPVDGAVVALVGPSDPGPYAGSREYGHATTDARGRYEVRAREGDPDWCLVSSVDLTRASRIDHRLTTMSGLSARRVKCGETTPNVDFRFSSDIWYHGIAAQTTGRVAVGGSLEIHATLLVLSTPGPGSVHRDSLPDWLWQGNDRSSWSWAFPEDFFTDVTWDGYNTLAPPPWRVRLRAEQPGSTQVVVALDGTPFVDTIPILIDPGA